jgi:hypothetical protein
MSELAIPLEAISLRLKLARPGIQENQNFWIPPFDHTQDMLWRV